MPRREVLRDAVYDAILAQLVELHLEPGTPLRIDSLAKLLDVSPTPVREALVQLEATGLVTRTALKGYAVAPPLSQPEMAKLMAVRTLIESAAARGACAQADVVVVAALDEAQILQRRASERGRSGFRDYIAADSEFHRIILENCGNKFLRQCAGVLEGQVHRLRAFADQYVTDAEQAIQEHQTIMDAFVAHDPDLAETAMRHHLTAVAHRASKE